MTTTVKAFRCLTNRCAAISTAAGAALAAVWMMSVEGPPPSAAAATSVAAEGPAAAAPPTPSTSGAPVPARFEDGSVRHFSAPSGQPPSAVSGAADPEQTARRFLRDHAEDLGIAGSGSEFALVHSRSENGRHYVKLQQRCAGLPVFAATAQVQIGAGGGVEYVGNYLARDLTAPPAPPQPATTAGEAGLEARAHWFAASGGIEVQTSPPELVWFAPSVLALPGEPRLAWKLGVRSTNPLDVNVLAFLDAGTGEVLHQLNYTCALLHRSIFDGENDSAWPQQPPFPLPPYVPPPVRIEGGPSSSLSQANDAFNCLGDVYNFYQSKHGRDSISHSGKPLFGVVRRCTASTGCPLANAFWSGLPVATFPLIPGYSIDDGILNFGDGWAKDDIVAHEYTHGVTQYESGLVYQNASGAINEAFSDIWGEFVDLGNGWGNDASNVRWQVGEDLSGGRIRSMNDPPDSNQPDRLGSALWTAPAASPAGNNDFGGVHTNSGIINKLCFLLTDGATFNGHVISGLGVDRIAALFYEVNRNLLGSGADYTDLSAALHQAAINLGWNAAEQNNLHNATLAVEIVNNWVDSGNANASPNGCRHPGAGTGGPFTTMAPAVAALRSGDTLHLASGNYPAPIRITKAMKLKLFSGTSAVLGR